MQLHLSPFPLGDFVHNRASRLWLTSLAHQGEVRNLPVTQLAWTSVRLSSQLEVKNGLTRREHLLIKGLEDVGKLRHGFANSSTDMRLKRHPSYIRQLLVDFHIPQLRVHHCHPARRGGLISVQSCFTLSQPLPSLFVFFTFT